LEVNIGGLKKGRRKRILNLGPALYENDTVGGWDDGRIQRGGRLQNKIIPILTLFSFDKKKKSHGGEIGSGGDRWIRKTKG